MQILDKLNELKNRFVGGKADEQDVALIDAWIEKAKQLFILNSLKDHDGIKYVLEIYQNEIERINDQLLKSDSKSLPDQQRDRLLDRKEMYQKHLNLFLPIEAELEELEKKIDENY